MIQRGEPWGSPTSSSPDLEVAGGDAALAAEVAAVPGALVRFRPDATSDLARAVGLPPGWGALDAGPTDASVRTALEMDGLRLGDGAFACNVVVLGSPPDRLRWRSPAFELEVHLDGRPWFTGRGTSVVIANGQFLRGADIVPRGHPGDGRAEIQVYELARRERRAMRARLTTGSHLPHPRIRSRTARRVEVRSTRPVALEIDGVARPRVTALAAEVVPAAFRLLV